MLHHTDGPSLRSPLGALSVLLFYLLLTHSCTGQFQLIGPSQSIVAGVGDDVILPCHLKPAMDVTAETVQWTRADLNPRFIYVWRSGQALVNVKNPAYKERTSMFVSELKHGNLSLKLFKVKPSDQGTYECNIPTRNKVTSVQLVVALGATSSPAIILLGIDRNVGGVILNCESKGWYPEPEVSWLDAEGNLLSAGPTETVRGPDDLYTVSSRVTVEKRHYNNFTCRVQQKNINQIRETYIYIPDDFFETQCTSAVPVIIALAVGCVMLILLLLFFVWKWRQNMTKINGGEKNNSKSNKTEDQFVTEDDREREKLLSDKTVQMENLNKGKEKKKKKHNEKSEKLVEEQQRREEAENTVKILKEDLETKKKELEIKQTELQQLREEKQRNEDELQTLNDKLDSKNKELETIQSKYKKPNRKKNKAEQEVETLKNELETKLDTKIQEFEDKQAEVQQLQAEYQSMETNMQNKMLELESIKEASSTTSVGQDSDTGHIIVDEVDLEGKYVRLKNISDKDQPMRGWELHIRVNKRKPIIHPLGHLGHLETKETVCVELTESWSTGDRLLIDLCSDTGKKVSTKHV